MISVTPYINGQRQPSFSDQHYTLNNPATGEALQDIPVGCAEDVTSAVSAARQAFDDGRWSALPLYQRQQILQRWADLIDQHAGELDILDALDMGKPVSLAFGNAAGAANHLRDCAEAVATIRGESYDGGRSGHITQQRLPRGIVAAITPWNFPTSSAINKLAPALATGNTVVLKPSDYSPQSAMRLAELATEAGLPDGVFNLLPGKGETVGQALALHNDVNMIAFTGSTVVGKLMMQYAGQSNLKVVQAECGGKSPHLVFADYDNLDAVAEGIVGQILINQGQLCVTGSRVLVEKSIEAALLDKLAQRLPNIVAGDPLEAATTYGPLVNQRQLERVMTYIDQGKQNAELRCGGGRLLEDSGGYFVEPTLFAGVDPQSAIAQEEIFGPVLAVTAFDTLDQAIHLANATAYGLAAYAWTSNLNTGMALANRVPVATLTVNASLSEGDYPAALSYEPYGLSGIGVEGGLAGMETYQRRQVNWFNHN